MGAFIGEQALPEPGSREILRKFVQDVEAFDLSRLRGSLHDKIERTQQPFDYYRIMLEFARIPRSMWREIKFRFIKSLEAVQEKRFVQPFRLAFPATSCAFMIAPLDPKLPATSPEGEKLRIRGLRNLTDAAMYDTKSSTGVGILISKDEDYIQIDWSLIDLPWEPNPEMDARLAKSYPFREAKEKQAPSFLIRTEREERGQSGRHAAIVPDGKYAGMWRVRLADGSLSDMVNLTPCAGRRGLAWQRE